MSISNKKRELVATERYRKERERIEQELDNITPIAPDTKKMMTDEGFLGYFFAMRELYVSYLEAEENLKQLIEKSSTVELDEQEERELIKLDRFLEGAIDKQFAMPYELKTMSNSRRLISLIEKVDNLLGKIEK